MLRGITPGWGLTPVAALAGGAALPYDPVLVIIGDSNGRGNAQTSDQAAFVSSYVADPKVQVLNASGAFVQYVPGTLAGMNGLANSAFVGSEIGFIQQFRAKYPLNTLYVIKLTSAGAYQSRGISIGTITASISGHILTATAGTPVSNSLVTGTNVPTSTYIPFISSGSDWYISKAGTAGLPNYTVASTSMTMYNFTLSFSPTEGGLYNGIGASLTNAYRGKAATGLATLSNPKIIAVAQFLGTNDMAQSSTADLFQTDATAFIAQYRADLSVPSDCPIILPRVRSGATASTTVRAAQAAIAAADANVFLIDLDDLSVYDGTHYTIAGLTTIGARLFDVYTGASMGLVAPMVAWWNADDHGTPNMTDDGAGLISSWKDRIGGLELTAATTARPTWGAAALNSASGIAFDGAANTLRGTTLTGLPVSATPGQILALSTDGTSGRILCEYGGTSGGTLRRLYDSGNTVRASDGTVSSTAVGPTWSGPAVAAAIFGLTTVDARMNGVAQSPGGTGATLNTGTTRFAIGSSDATTAGSFWSGVVRHVIITTALTTAEQQKIEGYLARSGGVSL